MEIIGTIGAGILYRGLLISNEKGTISTQEIKEDHVFNGHYIAIYKKYKKIVIYDYEDYICGLEPLVSLPITSIDITGIKQIPQELMILDISEDLNKIIVMFKNTEMYLIDVKNGTTTAMKGSLGFTVMFLTNDMMLFNNIRGEVRLIETSNVDRAISKRTIFTDYMKIDDQHVVASALHNNYLIYCIFTIEEVITLINQGYVGHIVDRIKNRLSSYYDAYLDPNSLTIVSLIPDLPSPVSIQLFVESASMFYWMTFMTVDIPITVKPPSDIKRDSANIEIINLYGKYLWLFGSLCLDLVSKQWITIDKYNPAIKMGSDKHIMHIFNGKRKVKQIPKVIDMLGTYINTNISRLIANFCI